MARQQRACALWLGGWVVAWFCVVMRGYACVTRREKWKRPGLPPLREFRVTGARPTRENASQVLPPRSAPLSPLLLFRIVNDIYSFAAVTHCGGNRGIQLFLQTSAALTGEISIKYPCVMHIHPHVFLDLFRSIRRNPVFGQLFRITRHPANH